jgi:LytS/YehU family sensor histidine kinase
LPAFFVFLIAVVVIANLSVALGVFSWYVIKGIDMTYFFHNLVNNDLAFANQSLKIPLFIISVVFFIFLWGKASRNEIKLLEENFHYKYKVLKSQVNPHFLFNSLNTLSELIYSDVKKADFYIQKLSGIYRYILENEENDLVTLEKEISFITNYFELQKVRDDNKISLEVQLPDISYYSIIPVSLQILIENTLKHNARSVDRPLKISISLDSDFVVVSNNIQRKNTMESSTQKGLANLSERVKIVSGRNLVISEENESFTVRIPIIRS